MIRKNRTAHELRREGLHALFERLRPADAIRFLQESDSGRGDYTQERRTWLKDLSVDDVARDIADRRKENG